MSPTLALRQHLLASLALVAACGTVTDDSTQDKDGEDTDSPETDVEDTDDTDPPDPIDTGLPDETGETDDTDDTDDVVVDTADTDVDSDTDGCPSAGEAGAWFNANGYLDMFSTYTVCLGVPMSDPLCTNATSADLDAALQNVLPPICIYDTGTWMPINPPCQDGGYNVDQLVCGPEETFPGDCCYTVSLFQFAIGRPFVAEGQARLAPAVRRTDWTVGPRTGATHAAAAAAWTEIARAEHASVASFSAFTLDLLRLGAPMDLVRDAGKALQDEVCHAAQAFDLASRLGGQPVGPGPLDTAGTGQRQTAAEVLVALIEEGCVGETIAAHEASVAAPLCQDPEVRAALIAIARDEADHAALAWRTLRWLLGAHPELVPLAERVLDEAVAVALARPVEAAGPHLPAWGLLGGQARLDAARRCVDGVVRPTWNALRG